MKKRVVLLSVCIILVLIIIFMANQMNTINSDISDYLETGTKLDVKAKEVMPELSDLQEYTGINYLFSHKSLVFFESNSVVLDVEYDEKTYQVEKEKIQEEINFLNEPIISTFDSSKFFIPETEFSIGSYKFRIIDKSEDSFASYPKSFGMIAMSDESHSIAYLYFYDGDLDYIDSEMTEFVNTYFKYSF